MRYGWFGILLVVSLGIQFVLPQLWPPLRYVDFVLLLVFHAGRGSTARRSLLQGWLAGLAQDLTLSTLYPLGLQATTKMLVGLVASVANRQLNMDHLGVQMLLIFGLAGMNNWLMVGIFSVFGQVCPEQSGQYLWLGAAVTALLNTPIWLVLQRERRPEMG